MFLIILKLFFVFNGKKSSNNFDQKIFDKIERNSQIFQQTKIEQTQKIATRRGAQEKASCAASTGVIWFFVSKDLTLIII